MPRPYIRRYPVGKFGNWLNDKINSLPFDFYIFADNINISQQVIRRHMRETVRPSPRMIQMYADYFNEDFGYVYQMVVEDFSEVNNYEFAAWLWSNMTRCGYSVETLADEMGVSPTSIYTHMSPRFRHYPSFRMIRKYCEAFGISNPFPPYDTVMNHRDSQKLP